MNSVRDNSNKLFNRKILALLMLTVVVSACASKPQWVYPSGESRQFYEDENLCATRAERSMGNAGNYEPNNQSASSNAGAAIGNAIAKVVAKRRAMNSYKKCMQSMGYRESN
jgi:hypothetical protein